MEIDATDHGWSRIRKRGFSPKEILRTIDLDSTTVTTRKDQLRYEKGKSIVVIDKITDEVITVMRPLKGRGRRKGKKR